MRIARRAITATWRIKTVRVGDTARSPTLNWSVDIFGVFLVCSRTSSPCEFRGTTGNGFMFFFATIYPFSISLRSSDGFVDGQHTTFRGKSVRNRHRRRDVGRNTVSIVHCNFQTRTRRNFFKPVCIATEILTEPRQRRLASPRPKRIRLQSQTWFIVRSDYA